jgi:cob(I)alamin adenosyltransferase
MRIYTKTGDKGETSLYDGTRVTKDNLRVEAYGTLDELNSVLGFAKNFVSDSQILSEIRIIQEGLFVVGAMLATKDKSKLKKVITEKEVQQFEMLIDAYTKEFKPVNKFILPGSNKASGIMHFARTVCRRAERRIISLSQVEEVEEIVLAYINRLSDLIYAFARKLEDSEHYFGE